MSFWSELKRRNVVKVALFYVAGSWMVLQVAELLFEIMDLPVTWLRGLLVLLLVGFPVALVASWVFEITPDGVERESERAASGNAPPATGRRLTIATLILAVFGLGLFLADRVFLADPAEPDSTKDNGIPTVAVLPFQATGSDDGGFLAVGLHDDLLTRLARLEAFRVISRTSVMEYAGTTKNMREIGRELNARYILEGGVQALGNRVRINAQLIDTEDDQHVWAETFDYEMTAANIFDIQAELAGSIADEMQSSLSDADLALLATVPTQNIEAYNAYLRGLDRRDRGGHNELNNPLVVEEFEEAVRLDPEFAEAWAQLSIERSRIAQGSGEPERRSAALEALERARELAPNLHEVKRAHIVFLYRVEFEYEAALEALDALASRSALGANDSILRAYLLRRLGHYSEAYQSALAAKRLDPRSVAISANLVGLSWQADRCVDSERHAREAMVLAPNSADIRSQVAQYQLHCRGDASRANDLMQGVAFTGYIQVLAARDAAMAARDYARLLELADRTVPVQSEADTAMDRLVRATALRYLQQPDAADAELQYVAELFDEIPADVSDRWFFGAVNASYSALVGDRDGVRYWTGETERRIEQQSRGDVSLMAYSLQKRASTLAYAGLEQEALRELRRMVDTPGASRMPLVNLLPEFDSLRDHPDFIALLAEDPAH